MDPGLLIVVLAGGLFLGWRVSLVLFPEKMCSWCGGKGWRGGKSFGRTCGQCKGSGRMRRIGA